MEKTGSIIEKKTYALALKIVTLYREMVATQKEYVLSKQMLRSGTSIGANVNEAVSAQSKRDFVYKLGIALKEAKETIYWLNLLNDSGFINNEQFISTITDTTEVQKILSSIILTTKARYFSTEKTRNS
ncbi:MAG: four helix bundle protein [Paludibacteraceae bacterium]